MRDVVVVGGGPGGSVCATALARRGLSVTLLEKVPFPRFHLGESLLPTSLPVLEAVGALPAVRAAFLPKYGARFHDDVRGREERFAFADAWMGEADHAFQVPRDAFDQMLLEHARASGVDVRERWRVDAVVRDEGGRARGVAATDLERGLAERLDARFVVDASGRDALTAHAGGATTKIEGLDQTALYAHFADVPRREGLLGGDIDIVLFREREDERPNWFWFIPFADGRTSVGAVVSRAWIRARRAEASSSTALFERALAESASARALLGGGRRLWAECEAAADFSYRVRAMHGPGWVAVGDAGGFIDPLFSTGAHIAMVGGHLAAGAIAEALAEPAREAELFGVWEERVRRGAETFVLAVQAFYAGPLVEYLFSADKRVPLRRSVTSLLAGDVFGDAVWLRDARVRLRAMRDGAPSAAPV